MTKKCTLKEAFIGKKLDEFQPGWRNGEDITAETKKKIHDYVASILPEKSRDDAECITDYSIQHMAREIRKRENLPDPKKSNKGNTKGKVSESQPLNSDSKNPKDSADGKQSSEKQRLSYEEILLEIKRLISVSNFEFVKKALVAIEKEQVSKTKA